MIRKNFKFPNAVTNAEKKRVRFPKIKHVHDTDPATTNIILQSKNKDYTI
jgi:hypothetical protein